MDFAKIAIDWTKERLSERSTWDGGAILAVSVLALMASPLIKFVGWAGVVYGAWRIYKEEVK